jgi:hypothetical protein
MITSVHLNSPAKCHYRFWFLLSIMLLLIRADALMGRKQASSIQQIYSLAPLLAFIKTNVNKGDVKSNKHRRQRRLRLDYIQVCFVHNKAFNYLFIDYTVFAIAAQLAKKIMLYEPSLVKEKRKISGN